MCKWNSPILRYSRENNVIIYMINTGCRGFVLEAYVVVVVVVVVIAALIQIYVQEQLRMYNGLTGK